MEPDKNIIGICISKSLKSEVRYVAVVSIRFYNSNNNEINPANSKNDNKKENESYGITKNSNEKILCLCKDKVFILTDKMENILESFSYEAIRSLELDVKNELFSMYLVSNTLKSKAIKLLVNSKQRGMLVKSLMCYYSLHFMSNQYKVKMLRVIQNTFPEINAKDKNTKLKGLSYKYKELLYKSYVFYIKFSIKDNYNNTLFKISYPEDRIEKNDAKSCEFSIEITDPEPINRFEIQKDEKDLSFYSYNRLLVYLKNNLKASRFWITKNKIYHKNFNFNEDCSQWEAWIMEARVSEPVIKNVVFLTMRRKFIPPFFDSYQNFTFIVQEDFTKENSKISRLAYEVIELAANAIHPRSVPAIKEFHLFLKAKIDALLLDEDTLFFYQNSLGILGTDVHKYGYEFLHRAISFLEMNGSIKERVTPIKQYIETKIKILNETELDIEL